MKTEMRILGWKAEGLRCPDHNIDCCNAQDTPLPITLIQMPNGTGKTTTLDLLQAALSGSAEKNAWQETKVMSFQKRDSPVPNGIFELRLLLNGKRVTITLEFDFKNRHIQYKTTRPSSGQEEGFLPPRKFRQFMTEDFVKFYVFDGELANNILSREHTHAQIAVESLFQINLFKHMKDRVTGYWTEQTNRTAQDQTANLKQLHKKLERWNMRLAELEDERSRYRKKLDNISAKLEREQKRRNSKIERQEGLAEQIQEAKEDMTSVENNMNEKSQAVLELMRDPHSISSTFASSLHEFKAGLDRAKLPESAAKEFFEELANEDVCICGRPINDEVKNSINERASKYLGSDDVALLNNLKSSINEAVGLSQTQASECLSENIEDLSALSKQNIQARNDLDRLNAQAEHSDPDVMAAKEKIEHLEGEIKRLNQELSRFEKPAERFSPHQSKSISPKQISCIKDIKEGISYLERQVEAGTETVNLGNRRDILNRIIEEAYGKALDHITNEIRDDANRRISKLMPDNLVRIQKIDRCVVLQDQSSGSAGENLSVVYAFLATLFNRSNEYNEHVLPFIVDSPISAIDNSIRPKIGQLAPDLTNQFIAFVISSEREQFLPALQNATNKPINYITLFRKNIEQYAKKAKAGFESVESADGIQVTGEDFFIDFQLNDKEDA